MIKKLTISSLLLCSSNVLMAEEVTPAQVEASDSTTKMESMQIRATAAEQPAVPANVPNTIEGVTAEIGDYAYEIQVKCLLSGTVMKKKGFITLIM